MINIGGVTVVAKAINDVTCFAGSNGTAEANVTGDAGPFEYAWFPAGGNASVATNLSSGNYTVAVKDQQGCTGSASVQVAQPKPVKISLGRDTTICPGGEVVLYPGKFAAYMWQDNTGDSIYRAVQTGTYNVKVTSAAGCTASASVAVDVNCKDLVFPTAFTPNGDRLNDGFGPLGTLTAVKDYTIRVFNRWGQQAFYSNNPYEKWEGKLNTSDPGTGTFIWIAEYSFNGMPKKIQKGTILLVK